MSVSLQLPPRKTFTPASRHLRAAAMASEKVPMSGSFIWTISAAAASTNAPTSSSVLHHSSATIATRIPVRLNTCRSAAIRSIVSDRVPQTIGHSTLSSYDDAIERKHPEEIHYSCYILSQHHPNSAINVEVKCRSVRAGGIFPKPLCQPLYIRKQIPARRA